MTVRPLSAKGTRTYSVWQPSMRQPSSQPPSTQLFTKPRLQNQHSPQKVSTLAATRWPGLIFLTASPTATTSPANSWPRITPSLARGTAPLRMWKSLVQMLDIPTLTMASRGSSRVGTGRSSKRRSPLPWYTTAIMVPLTSPHSSPVGRTSLRALYFGRSDPEWSARAAPRRSS